MVECLSGVFPLKLVAIDVISLFCVCVACVALEARRIAENLLLLKRDKMVAPALRGSMLELPSLQKM